MIQVFTKKKDPVDTVIILLYFLLFASTFFSLRAISSISVALLLMTGIVKQKGRVSILFERKVNKLFVITCLFFFLLQFTPLLLPQQEMHWSNLQMKTALLFYPLAVLLSGKFNQATVSTLWKGYCILLALALVYCMAHSAAGYIKDGEPSVFFYHELMKPLHQHAVYVSIYVFIIFIELMENIRQRNLLFKPVIHVLFALFFIFALILLSSKLVLLFLVISLVYYSLVFIRQKHSHKKLLAVFSIGMVTVIATVIITRNPVSERFREVLSGNLALAKQEKFDPGIYFTGAQARLLQWRFVPQIMREQNAWWTGVGSARAQQLMDEKYISTNMYVGMAARGDKGFIGFNTHNQLLASFLKVGIPGAIAFLCIFAIIAVMAWQHRKSGYLLIFLLLLAYSLLESVLETQYGLFLFIFFPVFLSHKE